MGCPYNTGTEALVVEATLDDGAPAVLKLLIPRERDAARHEIGVLRLAGGEGCVRLLRHDAERGVLLLERLGRPLFELGLPLGRRLEILCATAMRVWRPAPDCGFPTGAQKGRWLIEFITAAWEQLDRPCSEHAVEHALACAAHRIGAHDDERSVLVHGDVHQWNALQAEEGFKLVDPDGLLAQAEYDMGILMREDPIELRAGDPHDGRDGWQRAPAWTPRPSGSGAWSSGWQPAWSAPLSTCSRWDVRCSRPPTGWPNRPAICRGRLRSSARQGQQRRDGSGRFECSLEPQPGLGQGVEVGGQGPVVGADADAGAVRVVGG